MGSSEDDWIQRAKEVEEPERIILKALEESLASQRLSAFNENLAKLVRSDSTILQSTPLELVPTVFSSVSLINDHQADLRQTLELIARHGSAKEVLLVVQESLDSLIRSKRLQDESDGADPVLADPAEVVWKWVNLVHMYTLAFPRLILRKRSAPDTAGPIIKHLCESFDELQDSVHPNTSQAPDLVESCISLGYSLIGWFEDTHSDPSQVTEVKAIIQKLLFISVEVCLFDETIMNANNSFLSRLVTACSDFAPASPSHTVASMKHPVASFVIYALSERDVKSSSNGRAQKDLEVHQLGASCCLQQHKWRKFALLSLKAWISAIPEEDYLSSNFATFITPSVSLVAATDSNPTTRGSAFRLLTQVTLKVHPQVAFELVRQLVDEGCPYSNMRSSAVVLLRQLVARAFNHKPPRSDDPFAAEILLQEYAPILFDSPLLRDSQSRGIETTDPQEVNRIIESLGFYYVLLAKDTDNLTGILDPGSLKKIDREYISPLKKHLKEWESSSSDVDVQSALRAITVQLGRVDEMVEKAQRTNS